MNTHPKCLQRLPEGKQCFATEVNFYSIKTDSPTAIIHYEKQKYLLPSLGLLYKWKLLSKTKHVDDNVFAVVK